MDIFQKFGSTAPAKAAEILRKFTEMCGKFSARGRSANPTSRCMRQCELQKFRKGGVHEGGVAQIFAQVLHLRRF